MKGFIYRFIKRTFDLVCCIVAFPFFLILLVGISVAIKLEDGGPVFYMAERIGKNSKKLMMYKFRSMKVNAPNLLNADGSTYNAKNDPRVTRIGKFLRVTSLDETAQILNVLKGEMSLIGPRASGWGALESYLPDEIDKMKVRPGISGYTQAYYRNSISVREKRLLDAWYANNASLWVDTKIFFKTIQTVLLRKNVYTNAEAVQNSPASEKTAEELEMK